VRAPFVAILALSVLATSACERTARVAPTPEQTASERLFPARARDDLGRTVTVAKEPHRIVTLLPSHTETVCALGLEDRLVGIDDFSDFPPSVTKLPRLGGMVDARLEGILALSPDLVVLSEASPAAPAMDRAGLSVWAGSPRTLDDTYRVIQTVGKLVGRPHEARGLADRIRREVDEETARTRDVPRLRVYYELDATPYAVGPDSFIGELLSRAGGDNVVPKSLGSFPKVSPEIIATADPEVVIGVDYGELLRRPGWDRTSAVEHHRVFVLTPEERAVVVRPGPRIAEGIRVLSRKLHLAGEP